MRGVVGFAAIAGALVASIFALGIAVGRRTPEPAPRIADPAPETVAAAVEVDGPATPSEVIASSTPGPTATTAATPALASASPPAKRASHARRLSAGTAPAHGPETKRLTKAAAREPSPATAPAPPRVLVAEKSEETDAYEAAAAADALARAQLDAVMR
jgi:hypothetical protein